MPGKKSSLTHGDTADTAEPFEPAKHDGVEHRHTRESERSGLISRPQRRKLRFKRLGASTLMTSSEEPEVRRCRSMVQAR